MIAGMTIPYFILSVVFILLCAALTAMILMQKKRSAGINSSIYGAGSQQTYWDKNKGRSLEGTLERYSKILGAVFMILSLFICLIK